MIRQETKTVKTTMKKDNDRFVTPTIIYKTSPSKVLGVMIPTLDDDSAVKLELAPREHRFNYPCLDGKPKPEGSGYAENGIIFEFDMDDADGTTITDKVSGLVLTERGDPTFQESAAIPGIGNGVTFDGIGSPPDALDVTFADAAAAVPYPLVETGDFSVEVVFKATNDTTDTGDTIVCCRDGADGIGWQMVFETNEYLNFHVDDTTEAVLTGATDVATGSIVHVIVSLDRDGKGILYVNGASDDETDISGSTGTLLNVSNDTRFAIGGDAARTTGDCLYGTVYFVRVYNFALSAAEALENYRIMMNKGYPGWMPLFNSDFGGDLVMCKLANDPGYFDLTKHMPRKQIAMRAKCDTEQTTPTDLDFVWLFD